MDYSTLGTRISDYYHGISHRAAASKSRWMIASNDLTWHPHRRSGERYKTEIKTPHSLASQRVAVVAVTSAKKVLSQDITSTGQS